MAKKHVSRHPEFVRRVAEGVRKEMANHVEFQRDKAYWDSLSEYPTEEERRKSRNAFMRDLYKRMKSPNGDGIHLNYPGGPAKFYEDIESGMYDD